MSQKQTKNYTAEEAYLLKESLKRTRFSSFCKYVTPGFTWDWAHLQKIDDLFDRITAGKVRKAMIFMPPRHGKSEKITIRYPLYRLNLDPTLRIIIGGYGHSLTSKFSRKARNIARDIGFHLSEDRQAADDWETMEGGGMRAVGVGSSVTGTGGDIVIIDDPVKSREEAESAVYREKVWTWYTDDLYTRLEPGGACVLVMTRWHENDLAGRILDSEDGKNWEVLRLPAECETQDERDEFAESIGREAGQPDPIGREYGEPLCPDRFDLEKLADLRTTLGSYSYTSLYQQRPTPHSGGMFKIDRFEYIGALPSMHKGMIRFWDKASTEGGGCYTAGVLLVKTINDQYIVADVVRGQWSTGNRERIIKETAIEDGKTVSIYVEQEPGSGGKDSANATITMLSGYKVFADPATGDKFVRAIPASAQVEAGNVMLKRGSWNKDFIDELRQVPFGKFVDQMDAFVGAFNRFNRAGKVARSLGSN